MMRVVDTHLHLWDLERSPYRWLTPGHGSLYRTFTAEEARDRLGEAGVGRAVLVQADDTNADTRHLLHIAEHNPFVLAVVGWVQLDDTALAERQLEQLADPVLRGIRHLVHDDPRTDFLLLEPVQRSLELIARRGLLLEVPDAWPAHLRQAEWVARTHPDLVVVIDHLAKPPRGTPRMPEWAADLRSAAREPNVLAKISGLQVPGQPFTAEALRPVLHTALDAFGAERLMFGSDWPMTVPYGDYQVHWDVVRTLLSELSADESDRILAGTALQTYGEFARA